MNADYIMSKKALDSCESVEEYLDGLPKWDGRKRVDTMLHDYLGADDNAYTRAVSRKMLVAAVARALKPGCEVGFMPILWGEPGSGKTLLLDSLAGGFMGYAYSVYEPDSDDRILIIPECGMGKWILEIPEHLPSHDDLGFLKYFVCREADDSRCQDTKGGEVPVSIPRCYFPVWTTNEDCSDIAADGVLWPVQVHRDRKTCRVFSIDQILVAQLWAEAKKLYGDGESLALDAGAFSVYKELYGKGKTDETE